VEAGDAEQAAAGYREAVPQIDASVGKGLIHRNKAARHKSRLNRAVRGLQG
jgi:small subunit ribosomal protein S20